MKIIYTSVHAKTRNKLNELGPPGTSWDKLEQRWNKLKVTLQRVTTASYHCAKK